MLAATFLAIFFVPLFFGELVRKLSRSLESADRRQSSRYSSSKKEVTRETVMLNPVMRSRSEWVDGDEENE